MTRKKALQDTIEIIKNLDMDEERREELITALQLCLSELPFSKWSKEAIFDACDQFVEEHGSLIINDLYKGQLPSHSVIKLKFGMTAKEFRDKYYPLTKPSLEDETKKIFLAEYERIHPISSDDYDSKRTPGTPCVTTIVKRLGVSSWSGLREKFKLPVFSKEREVRKFTVSSTHEIDRFNKENPGEH